MSDFDFEGLARELISRARDLLPVWLPGGRLIGSEYTCGNLRGEPGDSMRVNVNTGRWADFSSGGSEKGGDLISLYAAIHGLTQGQAAKILAEEINFQLISAPQPQQPKPADDALEIIKPPEDCETPGMVHFKYGDPSAAWCYQDTDGLPMFYVARYDHEGGKELAPWSYTADGRWVMKGWPVPRPIYGLRELQEMPGKPVLIVEGEKAADAARRIVEGKYAVITWPNGTNATKKADWTPVYGRNVLIWPDADYLLAKKEGFGVDVGDPIPPEKQPGMVAAAQIAEILAPHCPQVKLIDVGLDPSRAHGWDAADAFEEGWDWEKFKSWAVPRARVYAIAKAEAKVLAETGGLPKVEANAAAVAVVNVEVSAGEDEVSETAYALWIKYGLVVTKSGQVICNADNVIRILDQLPQLTGVVWYDEFHGKHFTKRGSEKPREWSDLDDLKIMTFLQRELGMSRISAPVVHDALMVYADRTIKNEPRDWMESLEWDGKPRIEDFFISCFGTLESDYYRAASKNWWISLAARIYSPGCKMDTMIILEGGQGKFKSTALGVIAGDWYAEALESPLSKDFYMALHGKMIIEVAEMDSFRRAEDTLIKRLLAARKDRFRPPYGRASVDFPRRCVFVGTTNEDTYLRDHTGARRFWPIKIENIDIPRIKAERDQLFAEAVACFKAGETWWEMPGDMTKAMQEGRRQADEWEYVISDWLTATQKDECTLRDIAEHALKIEMGKFDLLVQRRIAKVLGVLRWTKHNLKAGADGQQKTWRSPDFYYEEPPF